MWYTKAFSIQFIGRELFRNWLLRCSHICIGCRVGVLTSDLTPLQRDSECQLIGELAARLSGAYLYGHVNHPGRAGSFKVRCYDNATTLKTKLVYGTTLKEYKTFFLNVIIFESII